jgi:steroid 5-alpha reductase family enzyme
LASVLAASALAVLVLMVGTWLISLRRRDASIVDIVWGLGFVVVAATSAIVGDGDAGRRYLLLALVAVWGLRLSGYLAKRNLGHGEDYRYVAMRKHWGQRFWWVSLFQVFLLQGVLLLVVSLPVQLAATSPEPGLGWLALVGIAIWHTGFLFETVGDAQLARFKADPDNAGKVMDQGLWGLTRHPNYFGDCCVWWGLFVVAAEAPVARWGVIGPLVMTVLLLRVSGVAMLEKTIGRRRPGYAEYQARVPAFFPRLRSRSG